jgi:hypothetical protein
MESVLYTSDFEWAVGFLQYQWCTDTGALGLHNELSSDKGMVRLELGDDRIDGIVG